MLDYLFSRVFLHPENPRPNNSAAMLLSASNLFTVARVFSLFFCLSPRGVEKGLSDISNEFGSTFCWGCFVFTSPEIRVSLLRPTGPMY